MNSNFKILYILGTGRSGTTLLDIVLGNSNNFFSAGELNRFTKRDGLPHDPRDKEVETFWACVNAKLSGKNLERPKRYHKIFEQLEYHKGITQIAYNLKSKNFSTYSDYQQQLFCAIHEIAGNRDNLTIIDSSKYPLRGLFLSKIFGKRVSLIYIKRQPEAIVESFQKKNIEQPSKSRVAAHLYILIVNMIAKKVLNLVKHTTKISVISYEQFISSPHQTIEKIEQELQIDLQKSKEIIESNSAFAVGPLFDGNRLRLEDEIHFRIQNATRQKPSHWLDKLFSPIHKMLWLKN